MLLPFSLSIVMYVTLLNGTWERYPYLEDQKMGLITTADECAREASLLKLRDGRIRSWACISQGDVREMIMPPYKWPVITTNDECDLPCLLRRSDERTRSRRH